MAMGRPRKKIDEETFKKLCAIQCTLEEIAGFLECSSDTVERWSKRTLKCNFAEAFKKYSAGGKISLRRTQFRLAENSAAMAIFLGKQYLGQKDCVVTENKSDGQLAALIDGLKEPEGTEGTESTESTADTEGTG